jgi:hypothetical protein
MKKLICILLLALSLFPSQAFAQIPEVDDPFLTLTPSPSPTHTPTPTPDRDARDVTKPEEEREKEQVRQLFAQREAKDFTLINGMAYAVQYAVRSGVPANTIVLILLLPFLATIVTAVRHVIGLPSIGLLVPIALSITLLATGITAGLILLAAILIASILSRFILKRVRIMQLPKLALSMLFVVLFIFATLTVGAAQGYLRVTDLSIFPVLLLILLSDRVVALFLERSLSETIEITLITLILGIGGFLILSLDMIRNVILLYPELVLLLIPINIIIGRYFGLRLTEYARFAPVMKHGSK